MDTNDDALRYQRTFLIESKNKDYFMLCEQTVYCFYLLPY